jgi:peptide chain release factor subunit 1
MQDFGTTLEFVSDRSTEGNQFVKGFGIYPLFLMVI